MSQEARVVPSDGTLAPGTRVGEYEVENLLGAGGMGEVYGAKHPVIGKRVALKVMNAHCSANPINVERFTTEAKAVNAIGHPNIVDIFSFGHTSDGRAYFAMEWLQGRSLRDLMDAGTIDLLRVLEILDAVLRALEAAHDKGIVHRDLKPDNIFVVDARDPEPERVKLLDFGIAKLTEDDPAQAVVKRSNKTLTGTVVGTPAYMAPEQASGGEITGESDVYSLGVVAYEMLAGRLPFDAESGVQIMAKHVDEIPRPVSTWATVPSGVEGMVMDMLAKDPDARPSPKKLRARIKELRTNPGRMLGGVAVKVGTGGRFEVALGPKVPTTATGKHARATSPTVALEDEVARMRTTPATPVTPIATPPASGVVAPSSGSGKLWIGVGAVGVVAVAVILLAVKPWAHVDKPAPTVSEPVPAPAVVAAPHPEEPAAAPPPRREIVPAKPIEPAPVPPPTVQKPAVHKPVTVPQQHTVEAPPPHVQPPPPPPPPVHHDSDAIHDPDWGK